MIPRERTARTNGTIAHGSRFARQKRLEGQTARGRRHQPQSEAVISGHGRVYRERRTDLAFSEDPNLRTPRLAELANSCSLDGHVLDGPKRRAMGRERTWPNHARHPPRQDLAWAISAGLRGLDRTDKGQRRARARKTKAVSGEGGIVRRRRRANPGAWRAQRFTGRRFFVPRRRRADFDAPALPGLAGAYGRRCALPLR